ncbi:hypothetical protein MA04_02973 [Alcanivorax balearicus MACL04]|uniref:DUF1963 domain-containing protein n=1 Tax=Alloalcanivorax balearicus MACL04 TaxID=1177182 RepID=A0ABT2R1M9_9GAMM|nr:YwqG family protein [Alloalcanivorax balearicus]MCU5783673.1 hypothetical protein [Alloalcanivorax balearicus MACL04]
MFDSTEEAVEALEPYLGPEETAAVTQALIPAIQLQPLATTSRPGESRLGGVPDLPAGSDWPRPSAPEDPEAIARRGNDDAAAEMRAHFKAALPYAFIAQIDLEQAAACPAATSLPQQGRLLFFYDMAVGPWESGTRVARVIWDDSPRDRLRPLPMPDDLAEAAQRERHERQAIQAQFGSPSVGAPGGTNYHAEARTIQLQGTLRLPLPAALEMDTLPHLYAFYHGETADDDTAELADAYDQALEELGLNYPEPGWRRHQLLGSPQPEQSDPRYDAVLITHFEKPFLDRADWDQHRARIGSLARQWRLLLQVDLSDWMQDSLTEGTVYFLIHQDDLAAHRFDGVMAVYQQT